MLMQSWLMRMIAYERQTCFNLAMAALRMTVMCDRRFSLVGTE